MGEQGRCYHRLKPATSALVRRPSMFGAAPGRALWPLALAVELLALLVAPQLPDLTALDLPRAGLVGRWIACVQISCLRPP